MFIYILILSLGFIGFLIHIWVKQTPRTGLKLAEIFLLYQMIFTVSFSSFLAFYGLTFMTQYVADYTNWPACHFEELLGNVNFSYGILGLVAIWIRGNFWTAIILGQSIWLLADAVTHIISIYKDQNYSPGNAGVPLYMDIFIPILLLTSLAVYKYFERKAKQENPVDSIPKE